jgi:hypothetical protein
MQTETLPVGERKHLALTILDVSDGSNIVNYLTAIIPTGARYSTAVWQPATTYDGKSGVWVEATQPGMFLVLAKVGEGAPNEVDIVECGYVNVRSR